MISDLVAFVKGWRRHENALITPFFQIKRVIALPILRTEGILAEMRQGHRITAQHQSRRPGATAEIHVIEMKIKPRIKAHALGTQGIAPRGQQYAIEQFTCRRC